jgi:hypothetical protein
MPATRNSKRFWVPHIGSMKHEESPTGLTYCVQMRVPKADNPSGSDYIALTDFTLDYTEVQKWLKGLFETSGRFLMGRRQQWTKP